MPVHIWKVQIHVANDFLLFQILVFGCGAVLTNQTGIFGHERLGADDGRTVNCTYVIMADETSYQVIYLDITLINIEQTNECDSGSVQVSHTILHIYLQYYTITNHRLMIATPALYK